MGNCFVLAAEEIVAVMEGQCGVQRGDRQLRSADARPWSPSSAPACR